MNIDFYQNDVISFIPKNFLHRKTSQDNDIYGVLVFWESQDNDTWKCKVHSFNIRKIIFCIEEDLGTQKILFCLAFPKVILRCLFFPLKFRVIFNLDIHMSFKIFNFYPFSLVMYFSYCHLFMLLFYWCVLIDDTYLSFNFPVI